MSGKSAELQPGYGATGPDRSATARRPIELFGKPSLLNDQAPAGPGSTTSAASTWPATLTRGKTRTITPVGSMMNVVHSTPIDFLPYFDFSYQTP